MSFAYQKYSAVKYRFCSERQILIRALENRGWTIRLQITVFTRWSYFTTQHLSRWWTCLQLSSTIMMLHVTGICRRITVCTIYQHTLSFYLPPPEFCHRGPTKQPPTTSLREIRQMSRRRVCVCVWKHKLIHRWNYGPQTPKSSQRKDPAGDVGL